MLEFIGNNKNIILVAFLAVYLVMSLITLIFYAVDKSKAKRHAWRIPEAVLLGLSWVFGSIGGVVGIYGLRHKTKHWYFPLNNVLSLIVHLALLVLIIIA